MLQRTRIGTTVALLALPNAGCSILGVEDAQEKYDLAAVNDQALPVDFRLVVFKGGKLELLEEGTFELELVVTDTAGSFTTTSVTTGAYTSDAATVQFSPSHVIVEGEGGGRKTKVEVTGMDDFIGTRSEASLTIVDECRQSCYLANPPGVLVITTIAPFAAGTRLLFER